MLGGPTDFWGKLDKGEDGSVLAWHPLVDHCADVAACAEALLTRTALGPRLATLGGREQLTSTDTARLSALAAFHDIGKFNLGFQRKAELQPRDTAGHVSEVLDLLGSEYALRDDLIAALPSSEIDSWSAEGGAFELLVAAIGHHGRPVACGVRSPDPSLWKARGGRSPFDGVTKLTTSVRRWFPEAFSERSERLPASPALQHGFAGLVMLADWLGSDRHETFFPFSAGNDDRMPFARRRAAALASALALDPAAGRTALGAAPPAFERVSPYPPRDAQSATMNLPSARAGGLTILESETGSGKTEAALIRFARLYHAGLVDGMTFALPTRTAATQLHARVVESMRRLFPNERDRLPVVLAVPGYLQFDDTRGHRLPGFEVLWNDDARERARYRGWAAEQPKRYLAGAVVVGTIDQVLLSSLRVSHAHLRATALLRHFLVVDEVHASDAYMTRILEEVLRFHLGAGGHALLMSATLGSYVRGRLEQAALQSPRPTESSLSAGLATAYPVIHQIDRDSAPSVVEVAAPGLPKVLGVSVEPLADDPMELAARALAAARAGARALVLRNTVKDAVETQKALEGLTTDDDVHLLFRVRDVQTLHHARFARSDRTLLDVAIEQRFGSPTTTGGVIAIATQTVQQSLDLDADILFTDLAPMDVLLQRFGRVHRHRQRDPFRCAGFERASAVVLVGGEPLEDCIRSNGEASGRHGAGTVYDDLLVLEATLRELLRRRQLRIPEENRELVELTTHPEALEALAHVLGPAWAAHRTRVTGRHLAHLGLADLNVVERNRRFGEYSFQRAGLEERIAARLGESDRRAVFPSPPRGPFGASVVELTLPGWLVREAPPDRELAPTDVRELEGPNGRTVRFAFGPLEFAYDRLGLRPWTPEPIPAVEDIADA